MDAEQDTAGVVSPSAAQPRIVLQPGQLSKPLKVWSSSSTLIIGFYQAAPYSETFKIFYKKSGAVFGTQVTLTPASILGPELAVRQPMAGEAQYFEYEIKKLKPSTHYVIKIKAGDDAAEVRSDKMGTVSAEEERCRDNDMRNFVGALVKLGEYDGLVLSYGASSGIFSVRILQLDDVASSLQLARLTSDYTDNGVPVQAYTLSEIRFGRWGGAITGSKVVNEGELKWLVARAVQMGDKSDAAAAFEARQRLLQAQVEKVTLGLEAEWATRFRNLRLRAAAYLLLLALVAVAGGLGCSTLLSRSGRRQRDLESRLGAAGERLAEAETELQLLHLYRVSLELDMQRRAAALEPPLQPGPDLAGTSGGVGNTSSVNATGGVGGNSEQGVGVGNGNDTTSSHSSIQSTARHLRSLLRRQASVDAPSGPGRRRPGTTAQQPEGRERPTSQARVRRQARSSGARASRKGQVGVDAGGGTVKGRRPSGTAAPAYGARGAAEERARARDGRAAAGGGGDAGRALGASQLWGLPQAALRRAMARGRFGRPAATGHRRGDWASGGDTGGGAGPEETQEEEEQPDAWAFIHYVSHVYAMHLQEWMKVQLQKTVRREVNEMLVPPKEDDGSGQSDGNGATEGAGRRVPASAAEAAGGSEAEVEPAGCGAAGTNGGGGNYGQCHGRVSEEYEEYDSRGYDVDEYGYDYGPYGGYDA